MGEASGAGIQAIETIVGARPEVAFMIDEQRQNVVVAQARCIRRIVPMECVPPRFSVEPVELAYRADPENPPAVLNTETTFFSSRLFGFPGSFRYTVNGEGALGKRFTPPPFVPTPDTAFAIRQQGKRVVVVQTRGISRIVSIPGEQAACTVKSDQAVGLCGEP